MEGLDLLYLEISGIVFLPLDLKFLVGGVIKAFLGGLLVFELDISDPLLTCVVRHLDAEDLTVPLEGTLERKVSVALLQLKR